jgi:rfaE bifunctional protein nucleotidyltransferase chain/domain
MKPSTPTRTAKLVSLPKLRRILDRERKMGKTIVWTNGAFDLVHIGHVRVIVYAKSLGDILIVGLNSDSSIRKYKSKLRPIISQAQRAEVLSAMEAVDYVLIFSAPTATALVETLKPDIFVKGGEYSLNELPEANAVRSYGGRVVPSKYLQGISTTAIIDRILELYCSTNSQKGRVEHAFKKATHR